MDAYKAAVVRQMKDAFKNAIGPLGSDRRTEGWEISSEENLSITIRIPGGFGPGPRYFEVKVSERY